MIPTIIGVPKKGKFGTSSYSSKTSLQEETYVGLEAYKRSLFLSLKYPIEHGIVVDWDDITLFLDQLLHKCVKIEDTRDLSEGILLTEAPLNPRKNREKICEIIFEQFQAPKFQMSMQSMNALYTEGRSTGLIVECGEGISTCVPIVEGFVISHGI